MEIVDKLKFILINNSYIKCQKVYLRGSYARRAFEMESDVDLLIISNDFKDISITKRKKLMQIIFFGKIEASIDCICLTEEEYKKAINQKREVLIRETMVEVF